MPAATFTLGSKIFGASLYVGAHNSTDQTNPSRVFVHMSIEQFTSPGYLLYIGDEILPQFYVDYCVGNEIRINQDFVVRRFVSFQDLLWLGSIITAHVLTSPRHPSNVDPGFS